MLGARRRRRLTRRRFGTKRSSAFLSEVWVEAGAFLQ